jgi:hypothetical protein
VAAVGSVIDRGSGFISLLANPELWRSVAMVLPSILEFIASGRRGRGRGDVRIFGDSGFIGDPSLPTAMHLLNPAFEPAELASVGDLVTSGTDVVQYLSGLSPMKYVGGQLSKLADKALTHIVTNDPPPMTGDANRFQSSRTFLATGIGFARVLQPFGDAEALDEHALGAKAATLVGTVVGKIDQFDPISALGEDMAIMTIDARLADIVVDWYSLPLHRRAWIVATVMAESRGTQFAIGESGAMGPAQLRAQWWKAGGSVWTSPFSWTGTAVTLLRMSTAIADVADYRTGMNVLWSKMTGREPEKWRARYASAYIGRAPGSPVMPSGMSKFTNSWRVNSARISTYKDPTIMSAGVNDVRA